MAQKASKAAALAATVEQAQIKFSTDNSLIESDITF